MNKKTAYCTVLTPDFVPGFYVLLKSLLETNPHFDLPFIVFYNPCYKSALEKQFDGLKNVYSSLEFRMIDPAKYDRLAAERDTAYQTPGRLKEAFYIIEIFGLIEFDQIIAIDSDMIVLDKLDELQHVTAPFSACRAFDYDKNQPLHYFNTGLMVVNQSLLDGTFYHYMLDTLTLDRKYRSTGKADQAILNQVLGENVSYLETRFNTTKRKYNNMPSVEAFENQLKQDRVAIIHYVGKKPWKVKVTLDDIPFLNVEKFWWKKLHQFADKKTYAQFVDIFMESQFDAEVPYLPRVANPLKDALRPYKHKLLYGYKKIKSLQNTR